MSEGYRGDFQWLVERPIAHRGLHDGIRHVPENSLPAAQAAIEAGYAIECDVQMSASGTPHVFHDAVTDRLTDRQGSFETLSDPEIANLRLAGTDAGIPTVEEFLDLVDGRVPIVMELKGRDPQRDAEFLAKLSPLVAAYRGKLALMSFDHWLIDAMLAMRPADRPIGLTAEGVEEPVLAAHRAIFSLGCDFVSYNLAHLPNGFVDWVRTDRGAPVISWTVKTADEAAHSVRHADQITFEGFAPQQ
ncbi:glycerophosphodiester phosphodiesterase family protein [Aurantimonas sp. VKM B-3413]|uniref:glycerophosphodiester phosphodiesterase family protein n=1 Tax=Aurantimonas sp. VKM B-3413 TaxID=2779401 RepID=UPI001E3851D2|nr:glycerophosphodiester phosphodiesterase family protein [Aurantimonas sp. VKM B-3413]MCB8840434.1 glycerophosphodiester phosphodiesterase [Aurantimonas sp. VKM B-3413]